jgi:hypothetical protein
MLLAANVECWQELYPVHEWPFQEDKEGEPDPTSLDDLTNPDDMQDIRVIWDQ